MFKNLKIFDNRILVLYIIQSTSNDLTLNQIASICLDFDDITYFDVCDFVSNLLSNNYIYMKDVSTGKKIDIIEFSKEEVSSKAIYKLTELGIATLNQLLELIPGANLYKLKNIIEKKYTDVKNDKLELSIGCKVYPLKDDTYKVSCYIKEDKIELINISLYGSNKYETANIAKNFKENSSEIYNDIIYKLTKKSNTSDLTYLSKIKDSNNEMDIQFET